MTIEQQQSDQDPPVPVNVNGYVDIQSLHVLAVNENHQDGNENQQEPNQNQNQDKEKEDVQMISDAPSNNTGGNDAPVDLEASHDEVTIAGSSNSNVKIQVINPTFVQSWSNEQLQQNMLVLLQEQTRRNNNKSNMADATTTTGHMDRNEIWKIQMAEMQQAQAILRRSSQSQSLGLPLPAGLSLPVLTTYDHQHQHQKQQQQGLPNINNVTQSGGNAVDASNNNTATPSNYGGIMQQSQSLASLPTATAPKTKLSQFGFPCLNMSYGNGGAMPTAPAQTPNYQDFGSGALKVLGGTSSNTNAPDVMKSSMQNASSQAQAPTQNLVKEGSSLLTFCKPKRKPLRPGLTASNRERQFVNHDYQDYCMEEPSNHEANLDMFYETKATINGPSIVKPIESVQRLAFPLKLHLGLTAIEDAGFTHIISWQPHGRAVLIHQPKDFEEQIMENFFAMKKLTSFQRQLNLYGFRRITCGADAGSYYVSYIYFHIHKY